LLYHFLIKSIIKVSQSSNFDWDIIARLEAFRKYLGLSKTKMGKSIDLSPQRYMNITNGNNTLTTMHIQALAKVYKDLNVRWLLSGKEDMLIIDLNDKYDVEILQLRAQLKILKEILREQQKGAKKKSKEKEAK